MKRLCAALLGVVAVCVVCSGPSAQAFLGYDLTSGVPGIPVGLPQGFGDSWGRAGSGLARPLSIYFGWLDHLQGSRWALQRQESTGIAPWPLRGFWLGASTEFPLGNRFGALVSGSIFFPQRSDGRWFTEP
ncbi:MAG: hypothetical protein AB1664_17750, partial [Thermodesulfobacteriota bacterium]